MKQFITLVLISIFGINTNAQITKDYLESLRYSHDLNLPDWGPYTKKYIGVSHIPDVNKGLRFDLSVFPGFFRRKVDVPAVTFESGYHPWEASPNLQYFSFRHELEWKDQVYTDISYSQIDKNSRLIKAEFVNNTNIPQSTVLHYMASIHFPSVGPYQPNTPINHGSINLPKGSEWFDALHYSELILTKSQPTDNLGYDGKMKGEIRDHGLINGSGIGAGFGKDNGDFIDYAFQSEKDFTNGILWMRYKLKKEESLEIELSGVINKTILLEGNSGFQKIQLKLGEFKKGDYALRITSNGGTELILDGFTIVENVDLDQIKTSVMNWNYVPEIKDGPVPNSILLKYEQVDMFYGVYWDFPQTELRQWFYKDLDDSFRHQVNEHVRKEFYDDTEGHFTNIFFKPVKLEPNSSKNIYGIVCVGTKEMVEQKLLEMDSTKHFEKYYKDARTFLADSTISPAGEKYKFSQDRMKATTASNVVYPVYTQKQYIRHHAPGRWWDSLYTWDAGFIGMGLLNDDVKRGVESLNAYLNETDEQSAFIHHGTPLPVQIYLFMELWNKTQSKELLEYFYPKLKRYYGFLAGGESSSTRKFHSNLISTWDYFYNSGGWDDYPPQKYIHEKNLEEQVAPVVSTSHLIRFAKILRMAATELTLNKDIQEYEKDIELFSDALQKHSWDDASGYFSYVLHDDDKNPTGKLLYDQKINFNMGLGGLSPLVAGITTQKQTKKMLAHLKTPGEIWSDVGLSAVDQSAPYYKTDGYWNGTVWMPHQWFFWKTMLDVGEGQFAWKIAETALDLWKLEVEASYNCMEHFIIENGRGAGWHQFGGLSTPVLSWFKAYFQEGTITGGFNVWFQKSLFSQDNSSLTAEIKVNCDQSNTFSLVACMNPEYTYQVFWNDKKKDHTVLHSGSLLVNLGETSNIGKLRIVKVN